MKKFLFAALAFTFGMQAQAQIVTSTSKVIKYQQEEKKPSSTTWFVKAGLNSMNFSGDGADGTDGGTGYNVTFGYQKPMGQDGAYWGMEFGMGSRGAEDMTAHNVQWSPFTFGWKIGLADKLYLDPHVGLYAALDYSSSIDTDSDENFSWGDFADALDVDYLPVDAGMNIGVALWYSKFSFDVTLQKGFVDTFSDMDGIKTSNLLIRLGYAF